MLNVWNTHSFGLGKGGISLVHITVYDMYFATLVLFAIQACDDMGLQVAYLLDSNLQCYLFLDGTVPSCNGEE